MNIEALFLDFDGVLTNNKVIVDENGKESVSCNRSDSLAIKYLQGMGIKTFIISSEKNGVVKVRAKKMGVKCVTGTYDKKSIIQKIVLKFNFDLKKCAFIGNDLNDLEALKFCGHSYCPKDANYYIKKICKKIIPVNGGDGVLRKFLDMSFNVNDLSIK